MPEGGQSRLEHMRSLGIVALGRELKDQWPGFLCSLIPHIVEAISLKQTSPSCGISLEEAIAAPPQNSLSPHPVEQLLQAAEEYRWRPFHWIRLIESLQEKMDFWELWDFIWPYLGSSVDKIWPWCTADKGPAEGNTRCELLIGLNVLPRASYRQHLT